MSETNSAEIRSFLLDLVAELGPGLLAASRERGDLTSKTSFHDVVTVHDEATEVAIREAIDNAATKAELAAVHKRFGADAFNADLLQHMKSRASKLS